MFALLSAILLAAPQAAPAEALLRDTRGRPVIRARINDADPVEMIVDTAAQASLIVPEAATALRLALADETIGVSGATGEADSAIYPVRRFASALFDRRDARLIALSNAGASNARGIVGMDLFAGRKLLFDRAAARLSVAPSSPAGPGYVTVAGRIDHDGFVEVPMTLDGRAVPAVVDTGAAVTIVNAAAFRLLGWADGDPRLKRGGEIRGAMAAARQVRVATVERVGIGPITLRQVPLIVTGGDTDEAPAIILGSDLLNLLDAFAVDFGRGELQVRVPSS